MLLHRDVTVRKNKNSLSQLFFLIGSVKVTVEGQLDKRGTFYGSVVCGGINWGEELLRGGWAK